MGTLPFCSNQGKALESPTRLKAKGVCPYLGTPAITILLVKNFPDFALRMPRGMSKISSFLADKCRFLSSKKKQYICDCVKLKITILLFNCLLTSMLFAQKEAWKWYFEQYNGLDFSGDTVKYLTGCQFGENESSSSICDTNGNMLFYSNGITLYNRYNKVVKNGNGLGFPLGLPNETSSYQGTLLLKHPDNDSLIYLFSTDNQGRGGGLVYAIIKVHGNKDSGEVLQKKIKLISPINEPINAVNHSNGRDIWIVCHSYAQDYFYSFLLSKNGVISCPIITQIGAYHYESGGDAQVALKFAPSGKLITQHQRLWGNTETFYFNNEDGSLVDTLYNNPLNIAFGFEFSPNSRYLYVRQADSGLIQIDMNLKTKTRLTAFNQIKLPIQMQKGPDGKIYGAIYKSRDLFVINEPNKPGDSCNVEIKSNFLQNTVITAMPNFNQSYFYTPSIDYKYELECISNSIKFWGKDTFAANSHFWQITRNKALVANYSGSSITHIFKDTGKFDVRYIASNGSRSDTIIKTITIRPKINKQFLGKDTIYAQGSTFSRILAAPPGMHCIKWQDGSGMDSFTVDTAGVYICKVTNQAFCEITDTVIIAECNNSLNIPSFYRSGDTLFANQPLADSFVWYRNGQVYGITKESFIRLTDTGHYRVEAAKKGYCNRSSNINFVNKLGINSISLSELNINLYPNPSIGTVYIDAGQDFDLVISDLAGRIIQSTSNVRTVQLDQGIYFFSFTVNRYRVVQKVIIY